MSSFRASLDSGEVRWNWMRVLTVKDEFSLVPWPFYAVANRAPTAGRKFARDAYGVNTVCTARAEAQCASTDNFWR